MVKLITVERTKKEVQRLQHFIDFAESYESDTHNKWIIKEYAYTNSIKKVVEKADSEHLTIQGKPLSREYAVSVINGKANDDKVIGKGKLTHLNGQINRRIFTFFSILSVSVENPLSLNTLFQFST